MKVYLIRNGYDTKELFNSTTFNYTLNSSTMYLLGLSSLLDNKLLLLATGSIGVAASAMLIEKGIVYIRDRNKITHEDMENELKSYEFMKRYNNMVEEKSSLSNGGMCVNSNIDKLL